MACHAMRARIHFVGGLWPIGPRGRADRARRLGAEPLATAGSTQLPLSAVPPRPKNKADVPLRA